MPSTCFVYSVYISIKPTKKKHAFIERSRKTDFLNFYKSASILKSSLKLCLSFKIEMYTEHGGMWLYKLALKKQSQCYSFQCLKIWKSHNLVSHFCYIRTFNLKISIQHCSIGKFSRHFPVIWEIKSNFGFPLIFFKFHNQFFFLSDMISDFETHSDFCFFLTMYPLLP